MRAYLDYNATTPVDPAVLAAMRPYFRKDFANASSFHRMGQFARGAVESAREKIAALLRVEPTDLIFTSGGTESDNLAIQGVLRGVFGRNHLVVSSVEHQAVLQTAQALCGDRVKVTLIPVDKNGVIDLDFLEKAVTDETALVSVMHVNNEIGVIEPIETAARIAHAHGAYFHMDAVQSFGKLEVLPEKMGVDLLSVSSHKLCGPKGAGALVVKKGVQFKPLFYGGHQEKEYRPGTENVSAIVGFGSAAELAAERRMVESTAVLSLRNYLEAGLKKNIPDIFLNGAGVERVYNTANVSFGGIDGEMLLISLDMIGIYVSTGSACTSGSLEPSHVLTAMGISEPLARSSVRFSLGRFTTQSEVDYAIRQTALVVKRLRKRRSK